MDIIMGDLSYSDIVGYLKSAKEDLENITEEELVFEADRFKHKMTDDIKQSIMKIVDEYEVTKSLDKRDYQYLKGLMFMHYLKFFFYSEVEVKESDLKKHLESLLLSFEDDGDDE